MIARRMRRTPQGFLTLEFGPAKEGFGALGRWKQLSTLKYDVDRWVDWRGLLE